MSLKKHLLSSSGVRKFKGNLLHSIPNPDPVTFDPNSNRFGFATATTNNYAIVGAYGNAAEGGTVQDFGRAYIYDVKTGTLLHTLYPPTEAYQSDFGWSVGITDNYCVVGHPEFYSSAARAGRAHVYNTRTGSFLYSVDAVFTYSNGQLQEFGDTVAISDTHVIVGSVEFDEDASNINAGRAFIYDVATGILLHTLENPSFTGATAGDRFANDVDICDNYAIVGAPFEDTDGSSSGAAYIYDPNTGSLLHVLNNPNAYSTAVSDNFGTQVAICDEYALVTASGEDVAGYTSSGVAYIFNPKNGELLHTLQNPNEYGTPLSDSFGGTGVSISKKYSIVSATNEDDAGGVSSGVSYVFDNATGDLLYTFTNPNAEGTSASDRFAYASISDDYAVIGAPDEAVGVFANSGYVYIYG